MEHFLPFRFSRLGIWERREWPTAGDDIGSDTSGQADDTVLKDHSYASAPDSAVVYLALDENLPLGEELLRQEIERLAIKKWSGM